MTEPLTEEEIAQHVVNVPAINPNASYDRDYWVKYMADWMDVQKWLEDMKKDPNDPKPRGKLTGMVLGDPNAHLQLSADRIRAMAKTVADGLKGKVYDKKQGGMMHYVRKNLESFLDKIEADGLYGIVFDINLCKTGIEGFHDRLVDMINEVKSMSKMYEDQDGGKMNKYIVGKIKQYLPEWVRKTATFIASIPGVTQMMFQRYHGIKSNQVHEAVSNSEGEPDKGVLENVFRTSLRSAEDEYDRETNEGKKGDIASDVVEPHIDAVAKASYGSLKEASEWDAFPDLKKREAYRTGHLNMAA